jgi:tRNA(His) guanylyltransferase
MEQSLSERITSYEDLTDYKLLKRLPLFIVLNGRNFSKITSLLDKPYSALFMKIMCSTMIKLCQEISGVIFAYSFNDNIVILTKNDQNTNTDAWFDNRIQNIVSASASIATLEFNKIAYVKEAQFIGDPTFIAKTFVVPTIIEAANVLIGFQQECFRVSLSQAAFFELIKYKDADAAKAIIANKTPKEKADILFTDCGIEFNKYSIPFKRGVACYRSPKAENDMKNKLIINDELPLFSQDKNWLFNILNTGSDILRLK